MLLFLYYIVKKKKKVIHLTIKHREPDKVKEEYLSSAFKMTNVKVFIKLLIKWTDTELFAQCLTSILNETLCILLCFDERFTSKSFGNMN